MDTWFVFASEDLRQVVVERMLAGVTTRRHVDVDVGEPVVQTGTATSESAVSRRFVAATQTAMAELLEADLSELDPAVLMIGGLNVPGEMIVVALVICADGTKIPVGLRLGDTENATVVKDLLADLVARGLRYEHGILAVIDGSKALRSAIVKVFGSHTLLPEHLILVVAGTTHAPPTMSAMDRRSDGGAKALATVRGRHIS